MRFRFKAISAKFEILLNMADQGENGCIQGSIEYNTDLYDASTMERVAERYRAVLADIVNDLVW